MSPRLDAILPTAQVVSSSPLRNAVLQVAVTLTVLAWVPGTITKTAVLLGLWALLFLPLARAELGMIVGVCIFFFGMNASALKQGIFKFHDPDVLGMPFWELVMWGFYLLHVYRFWGGVLPDTRRRNLTAWVLGLLFSAAFSVITDQLLLFWVTAGLLLLALVIFHDRLDLAYAGHMVLLGAMVEYVGVHSGQWLYPMEFPGGVPPWFITMWGGIGLFFRRLVLPWMSSPRTA